MEARLSCGGVLSNTGPRLTSHFGSRQNCHESSGINSGWLITDANTRSIEERERSFESKCKIDRYQAPLTFSPAPSGPSSSSCLDRILNPASRFLRPSSESARNTFRLLKFLVAAIDNVLCAFEDNVHLGILHMDLKLSFSVWHSVVCHLLLFLPLNASLLALVRRLESKCQTRLFLSSSPWVLRDSVWVASIVDGGEQERFCSFSDCFEIMDSSLKKSSWKASSPSYPFTSRSIVTPALTLSPTLIMPMRHCTTLFFPPAFSLFPVAPVLLYTDLVISIAHSQTQYLCQIV